MRTTRPLAVMLAVSFAVVAVPAAHAQRPDPAQADMHASVALAAAAASQQQDLRSADARESTAAATTDATSRQPRTAVADVQPAGPANSTDDGGTANGLGAVAGLIVIGLAYLYARRGHRANALTRRTSA